MQKERSVNLQCRERRKLYGEEQTYFSTCNDGEDESIRRCSRRVGRTKSSLLGESDSFDSFEDCLTNFKGLRRVLSFSPTEGSLHRWGGQTTVFLIMLIFCLNVLGGPSLVECSSPAADVFTFIEVTTNVEVADITEDIQDVILVKARNITGLAEQRVLIVHTRTLASSAVITVQLSTVSSSVDVPALQSALVTISGPFVGLKMVNAVNRTTADTSPLEANQPKSNKKSHWVAVYVVQVVVIAVLVPPLVALGVYLLKRRQRAKHDAKTVSRNLTSSPCVVVAPRNPLDVPLEVPPTKEGVDSEEGTKEAPPPPPMTTRETSRAEAEMDATQIVDIERLDHSVR